MKNRLLVVFLLMTLSMMIGCTTSGVKMYQADKALKPCKVEVPFVETVYAGKECVTKAAVFAISNPNDFMVKMESLEYFLNIDGHKIEGKSLDTELFIPANGKIEISNAFPVTWAGLALGLLDYQGIEMKKGVIKILPLWKGLNGQLFNPKLKEFWNKAEAKDPIFSFVGRIVTVGPDGRKVDSDYSVKWSMNL